VVQIHPPQPIFPTTSPLPPRARRAHFPKNFPNNLRSTHCDAGQGNVTVALDIVDPPVGLYTPAIACRRFSGFLRREKGAASSDALRDGLRKVLPMSSDLFSEPQAAAYLSISLTTLRRWRRAGCGPVYFRLGAIIRYRQIDLDTFVSGNLSMEVAHA